MRLSDFTDERGKRVVFLNNCLLNQLSRGPGVAFRKAASTELVRILLDNEVSIQQLPCLECMGFGGVSRKTIDPYFPILSHSLKHGWYPFFQLLSKVRLALYGRLCKREAVKVADRMADYIAGGFTILGVVGINDSPTCGVTRTTNLIEFTRLMAVAGETGKNPKDIGFEILEDGTSYFIGALKKELKKRALGVQVIGYEPWTESHEEEAERVAKLLGLQL
ncbi:MAG: hypothetical protein AB1640_10375 [bacterium]